MTVSPFSPAPRGAVLLEGEIHVIRANLNPGEDALKRLDKTLDAGETDRASRFKFPKDRQRFIAAHGLLRSFLASYLNIPAHAVSFTRSRYGKPSVEGLKFNMSHSEALGLFAFSRNMELGVDVEFIRKDLSTLEVARDAFTQGEYERLCSLPPGQAAAHFFGIWTCKEAYVKAVGKGLSLPLKELEVSTMPVGASLFELDAGPGYAGALAVLGKPEAVRCYDALSVDS